MNYKSSIKASLKTSWIIIKLIVPIYIFAEVLYYYNTLSYISFLIEPIASILDLPKEATLSLISGMFLNLYAAIAFAAPLDLSAKDWTILAVFLGVCHSLIVETAVMKKIGLSVWYSILFRIISGFLIAYLVTFIPSSYFGEAIKNTIETKNYTNIFDVIEQSFYASIDLTIKVIVLITIIIFFMDFLKNLSFIKNSKKNVSKGFTLAVGVILGITYGAGVLIEESKSGSLSKEDVFYIGTFLMVCHAIIEDTLLFVIFNADMSVILITRTLGAFAFASLMLFFFNQYKKREAIS